MKGMTNYLELENTLVGVAHSVEDAITEQQQYFTVTAVSHQMDSKMWQSLSVSSEDKLADNLLNLKFYLLIHFS